MIPKIIHYCWFGGKEKPQSVLRYIETWKTILPDWEIKEWNETNTDLEAIPFIKEAYSVKKYAFVSDVVRLKVLYEYGGVYLDTDVEVLKNIDDFLIHSAFISFEGARSVSTAVIGAEKYSDFVRDCLAYYENRNFINQDRQMDMMANTKIIAEILRSKGLIFNNQKQDVLRNYLTVYPITFFSAKEFPSGKLLVTKDTYCIHHFFGSWLNPWKKFKLSIHRLLKV